MVAAEPLPLCQHQPRSPAYGQRVLSGGCSAVGAQRAAVRGGHLSLDLAGRWAVGLYSPFSL